MTDPEMEVVKRVRDRIRDLLFDHTVDLEERLAGCKLIGDPLGIALRISADLEEIRAAMDPSGLGIFELLEVWMDLIEEKGI